MTTTERYIKELFGTKKYKIMTTTERNLLIAEAMGLKINENSISWEIILEWLRNRELTITMRLDPKHFSAFIDTNSIYYDKDLSEAFLQAVEEYCLTLKNQK
jgi:hypothetical protein